MKLYCLKYKDVRSEDCQYCYFKKNSREFKSFYCDVAIHWKKTKEIVEDLRYTIRTSNCKGCYTLPCHFLAKRRF